VEPLYQASQGEHNLVVEPQQRALRDDNKDQPMATRHADLSTALKAGSQARVKEPLSASHYGVVLAVALAALLLIRLIALKFNATDLFFDEAQYWSWSLEPAFGYYSKPPLIAWLIGASTAVCGVSEFCIRLPSPLVHTATAAVIYALGARLYSAQVGFWSALAFATLPGVSFSAGIISTDVPLLFTWALALLGFVALLDPKVDTKAWWPVALIALGLGLGLNAKYAMAYFALSVGVYVLVTPEKRTILRDVRLWAALALGVAMIAPNLLWNASNKFATFAHTADNAKLGGSLMHPLKALEFLGTQFGVFGPILFGSLIAILYRAYHQGLDPRDRMLLCFTLPVIAVVTGLAFLSRAHANWAAVSYVAATVLVIATLVRDASWGWLKASLGIHLGLLAAFALATATAGQVKLPANADPLARTLGWRAVADATRAELAKAKAAGKPYATIITDERALSAELLYYMRDEATPLLAWRSTATPADHYELTRPFTPASPQPVLLVAMRRDVTPITKWFTQSALLSDNLLPAGATAKRAIAFYGLDGYKK
jgi:4-amino-4-deoxy-L-arabinose transferase-like glycosyltransferase